MANTKKTTNRTEGPGKKDVVIETIRISDVWDFLTGQIEDLLGTEAKKEIWQVISSEGLSEGIDKICARLFINEIKTPVANFLRGLAAALADPKNPRFDTEDQVINKLFNSWVSTNGAVRIRKLIVLLWAHGLTYQEISNLTGHRENSVGKIIKRFREEGVIGAARKSGSQRTPRHLQVETARSNLKADEILIIDAAEITGYRKSYMLGLTGKDILWSRKEMGYVVVRRSEIIERMPKRGKRLVKTKESS